MSDIAVTYSEPEQSQISVLVGNEQIHAANMLAPREHL